MIYTKQQAMEAIRQHPELAAKMKLSAAESVALNFGLIIERKKLELAMPTQNVSRIMRNLIEKGYVKRVSCGVFERV